MLEDAKSEVLIDLPGLSAETVPSTSTDEEEKEQSDTLPESADQKIRRSERLKDITEQSIKEVK
jgi:hypothetical protein